MTTKPFRENHTQIAAPEANLWQWILDYVGVPALSEKTSTEDSCQKLNQGEAMLAVFLDVIHILKEKRIFIRYIPRVQ